MRGPLPIVVGITGHRDIDAAAVPALERQIATIFDELASTHRHTPLLLLSPLAKGADRIAARVAASNRSRIPIVVPLPFDRAEYEKDFDAGDLAEFDMLMRHAFCTYFVGYAPGNDAARVAVDERARNRQYAQVGSYIARQSNVLIALWNGIESGAVGGTAQIVKLKREGVSREIGSKRRRVGPLESGAVYHIITPRKADERIAGGAPFETVRLEPVFAEGTEGIEPARSALVARATFSRIERFNRDAIGFGFTQVTLSASTLRQATEKLAQQYRDRTRWTTIPILFACGFWAALTFDLSAHGLNEPNSRIRTAGLACSAATLALYGIGRRLRLQTCYQDCRAIAEALRVQAFWRQIDVRETVAEHYLPTQRGEIDWIRSAIRVCRMLDASTEPENDVAVLRARMIDVSRSWIDGEGGQLRHFTAHIERCARQMRNWKRTSDTLAAGLYLTAFTVIGMTPQAFVRRPLIIAIGLGSAACVLAVSYAKIRVLGAALREDRRMQLVYRRARRAMLDVLARADFTEADYRDAQLILRDLGHQALAHGAWIMRHRERPLESPLF